MGRKAKLFLIGVFIVYFCLFSYQFSIKADNSWLVINNYEVNAQLSSNGDMKVEENMDFIFNGSFNGVTKQILFPEGTSIENLAIMDGEKSYKQVSSAVKGDRDVYTVQETSAGNKLLWIYEPSANMSRSLKISYDIKNAAKKYNDTGELYWRFIGSENKTPINKVSINIVVPPNGSRESFKVFAHGPLTGNSSIIDDRTVNLSIDKLPEERYVEARVLFQPELISEAKRVYKENVLSSILSEEAALADASNEQRQEAKKDFQNSQVNNKDGNIQIPSSFGNKDNSLIGVMLFLIAAICLFVILYLKNEYGKDPEAEFKDKYYSELPGNYPPAIMSSLYYGNVGCRDITATLMSLIRKKYLKLEIIRLDGNDFFSKEHKTDYIVCRLNTMDYTYTLFKHEKYLMDWLLFDLGNGESFSFSEAQEINSSRKGAMNFKSKYNEWANIVKAESQKFCFYEYNTIFSFRRRTQHGADEFAKWKAFKNFLQDFGQFEGEKFISLVDWEKFLPYAISLGVAQRVIGQLRLKSTDYYDYDTNYHMLTFLYMSQLNHDQYNIFDEIENINESFTDLTDSAMSIANSSDSSSMGDGGGFSGGLGGGDIGGSSSSSGGDGGGGFGSF